MKAKKLQLLVYLCVFNLAFSQVTDDFSDGDFSNNPTWSGTTGDFIVNGVQQLQLNSTIAGISALTIPHMLNSLDNKEWRFFIKFNFDPSSSNYGRVFLTSTVSDISQGNDFGYFLQFGEAGTNDVIKLYKSESAIETLICSGPLGQIANSFQVSIRVKRNTLGDWSIYGDFSGGQNYSLIATGNDPTNYIGNYFIFSAVYTISNATKFYYDNVYVGNEIIDNQPPLLDTAIAISATQVDAYFNEALDPVSAQIAGNYIFNPTIGASLAVIDGVNPSIVHLTTTTPLINGTMYNLIANNISDVSSNLNPSTFTTFQYLVADSVLTGDVIINEFFPDPTPLIGLPEVEFVEVYNKSNKIFNLTGWKIGDASSDGTITEGWLLPGEYKVLTATASIPLFTNTTALGVTSFPSLNNAGDDVVLKDTYGQIIDKLTYTDDWYRDDIKQDGGYSLELINPNDPCSDADNWIASNWILGGTPGYVNSVWDLTPDTGVPEVILALALAPNFLELHFNEGMDSASLTNSALSFNPNLTIQNKFVLGAHPNLMTIQFNENLQGSQLYSFTIQSIADCWLNQADGSGTFILPEIPQPGDVVINEILQNPLTGGQDWIELYNNSSKVVNLKDWQLANFDNDTIDNFKTIPTNYILQPNDYVVIGKDSSFVKQNYPFALPGKFLYSELPSYNNDSGTVYLLYNSEIIDKVSYLDTWHFDLLDDTDGVSLERIDPSGESSGEFNWHSAAEDVGFATPGRINSQYRPVVSNGEISLTTDIFSPDNDGYEDVLQISYELASAGMLGKAQIFDDRGRLVRTIFTNELLGTSGTFSWDGVTDNQVKASIGVYVLVVEVFSTDGGVFFAKQKAITLAGKL
jgi:hypothetical protein